ncbi:MAG TPA: DUF1684 domain-containing protein [Candidatus Limnocylindrales bacterium]|nr:DUF1684 domain-containing protein [Candidatus Limnocylindrales bacterium]
MSSYLELADWRRRVAEIYADWRRDSVTDAAAATLQLRARRTELFRSHSQSPIPIDERARFGGLSHWPYDPALRMTAAFESDDAALADPHAEEPAAVGGLGQIQLPTSGASPFKFRRVGSVRLSGPLAGTTLPVYWMLGYAGGVFVPFRDATSGTETYGAGRYLLDTVKGADQGVDPASGELVLDFNLAFHPSCTYDPKWNCPLAPPESHLSVPVSAGERLPG